MVDLIGLTPVLAFFFAFWALTDIWRSKKPMRPRMIWSVIALVPFLGFAAWFLAGPRRA